ncbi:hypothetical protein AUEXF2481DRAFT_27662 [Aureobasidium subglaciale EXF-2481]|uniref:Uncharacterized protein n=1 Tax=Aureobasidium subglaciale (strain EXF-2481) TaxID=1043005 RepID=A0A074YMT0_AURSE|nr:uncharacterized protein AUEXF2481DRAFT_27662 [Aureobasidium subglaciale EXF-2481]KEQ97414.1 hypothetical protein AUEXF2481DRAFT_27662 [Aureobasidium subglaciale EXF-2481]
MDTMANSSHSGQKRIRDDSPDLILLPLRKRLDLPQIRSTADTQENQTDAPRRRKRSVSPDGGVAIDEETLAKFRIYRDVVPSIKAKQLVHHAHVHDTRRQSSLNRAHRSSVESALLPQVHVSTLPVFQHTRGSYIAEPGSVTRLYKPFTGLQPEQPLGDVLLNPRLGMEVEGGKLYLAQTLHHYCRKQIQCPLHGQGEVKPGHNRTARKVQETGQVYRAWYCATQPKWEGHRIDNTEYIQLAMEQLEQPLFDKILLELIRQLRFKDCQPVGRGRSPQPDDFDYHDLLQYVKQRPVDSRVMRKRTSIAPKARSDFQFGATHLVSSIGIGHEAGDPHKKNENERN